LEFDSPLSGTKAEKNVYEFIFARDCPTQESECKPDDLAGRHPASEEALLAISGSIRNYTALLEVLVETRIANRPE